MGLCGVAAERAAGAAEAVVERDRGGEGGEASREAHAQVVQGARAVAFEGEDALGGSEDRFDSLADRGQAWPAAGFVFASGPLDAGVERLEVGFELLAA